MEDGRGDVDAPDEARPIAPEEQKEPEKSAPDVVKAAGAVGQGLTDGKDAQGEKEKESSEKEVSAIREWLELICRAGFWALILYLFFFQVSVVEGPSMEPTFQTNDRLVIDKLTYRFSDVHRFDVVVFQAVEARRYRGPNDGEDSKDYIKRVIGLPGEKVTLKVTGHPGGEILKVFINDAEIKEPADVNNLGSNFPLGKSEFMVPPHHYFVMGDHRSDSKDSRDSGLGTLGFVSRPQIRGLARLRFLPLSKWKWFWRE